MNNTKRMEILMGFVMNSHCAVTKLKALRPTSVAPTVMTTLMKFTSSGSS